MAKFDWNQKNLIYVKKGIQYRVGHFKHNNYGDPYDTTLIYDNNNEKLGCVYTKTGCGWNYEVAQHDHKQAEYVKGTPVETLSYKNHTDADLAKILRELDNRTAEIAQELNKRGFTIFYSDNVTAVDAEDWEPVGKIVKMVEQII